MRISLWIALVAAGAVALAGCSSSSEPKKDQPAADAPASQPAPQQQASAPQKQDAPASFQVRAPATFNVTFDTTKGPVVIEVHRDWPTSLPWRMPWVGLWLSQKVLSN